MTVLKIIIGSARHDETGAYTHGKPGDSLQKNATDFSGEVSMQPMYAHKKGWVIIRAKDGATAVRIASNMKAACNNANIGYSQSDRYGIIRNGINAKIPTNCDCSSLVRQCIKEATGIDPGDFTTANAVAKLISTGLFLNAVLYSLSVALFTGDILCTRTKGHIVIVTDGNPRTGKAAKTGSSIPDRFFLKYEGTSISIVTALNSLGIDSSMENRRAIAKMNGFSDYQGSMQQNIQLLSLLKQGLLKRS